ncbi:MFS transporter [Bombilactobacillus thymidiniphilus]|uniref:MFS transporter n=1 Tax=Bombilactobacillus thymidiniphilus TaxID=2923363 RepID=A0ABY4PDM0_9LACO|nr:MFS transporter [Bombilactobacillus thymidiniphilus]UQS83670.1 MFS transporter [Bombilactobacillus thymidiniphilus]
MKKIWQLVFNDFLSNVAIQSFDVYTIWYIAQITKDQRLVALFGSVGIINVLLSPIGGVFADNYPRDKIIKVTSVIRSFGFLVFLIFVLVLHDIRYLVVSLSFLLSLLGAFYTPAIQAIVPNISQTDDELFSNNTYVSTANQLASITGAGVGGILIMIVRPRLVYLMITILIIMATLFIIFLK